MEKLPDIFSHDAGDWPDDRWDREWAALQRTWMPTKAQLSQISDIEIEIMAVCWPLPTSASDAEFLLAVRRKNLAGLEHGRRQGWWRDFSPQGPDTPAKQLRFDDCKHQTLAHVMADLGWFPSVSQARKNGWDRPVERGLFKVGKNRVVEIS